MHIAILARVRGLLAQFTEVHGDSVWLPRRALSLTAVYDTGFDAVDLVSTHPPRVGHLLRRRLDPGHPHALTELFSTISSMSVLDMLMKHLYFRVGSSTTCRGLTHAAE